MKDIVKFLENEMRNYKPTSINLIPRVLVVDDEADFTALVRDILSGEGYDVTIAHTPDDAVKFITSTVPFRRIFIDLNLGAADTGVAVCEKIRSIFPNIPITIISGFVSEKLEGLIREKGFDVIRKAVPLDELRNKLVA